MPVKKSPTYTEDAYPYTDPTTAALPYADTPELPRQKATSIAVHVVRMATVTMSFAELDLVCGILANAVAHGYEDERAGWVSDMDKTIVNEFIAAVESIR